MSKANRGEFFSLTPSLHVWPSLLTVEKEGQELEIQLRSNSPIALCVRYIRSVTVAEDATERNKEFSLSVRSQRNSVSTHPSAVAVLFSTVPNGLPTPQNGCWARGQNAACEAVKCTSHG